MNDYLRIPVPIEAEAGTTPPMTPHKICRKCKYVGLLSGNDKTCTVTTWRWQEDGVSMMVRIVCHLKKRQEENAFALRRFK